MEINPKIQKWISIGIRCFAEEGVRGIHIDKMSKEMGVAKTSFYFFFNSKEEFLEQLFAYWEYESTDRLYHMIDKIKDPAKRFLALGALIKDNLENEQFYIQLKIHSVKNRGARKFVQSIYKKRLAIATKLFKDNGMTDEEAVKNGLKLKSFLYGQIVMSIGHSPNFGFEQFSQDETLDMFGFKH